MKILVICQYYYPEPFRLNDLCEELILRGHEVTVVTGEPNYPEGTIYPGYEHHQKSDEIIRGVTVHRCPIIPRKTGTLYRFLNYCSYPFSAKKYVKHLTASDGKAFDAVFVNQLSPVMMADPAIAYGRRFRVPVLMYCLDLWPESLIAGGIRKGSFIYRIFHRISRRIYRGMDRILITSRLFRDYLKNEFGIDDSVIEYLPQYAEEMFGQVPDRQPDGITRLLFAGNIGAAQSVDTILGAAEKLKDQPVHFDIVGSGSELERLRKMGECLPKVTFHGRRPLEEMPAFYARADAMLVTLQADPVISLTLPGKVQSYMAAGKPVIGAIDGETASILRDADCGYCGKAEDAQALADNILLFMGSSRKKQMAENARKYYEQHFERKKYMDRLEAELLRITQ